MEVLAHRGASGYSPENTKASILKGLMLEAGGFEVDVQLSKDDEIVVFHDWTLDRTTTGTGLLKDYTLKELKALEVGGWFHSKYKGEKILTLKELLEIVPKEKILNIEIKVRHGEINKIEEKIVKILKENCRIDENIIISSFDHRVIKRIKKLEKKIQVGLLVGSGLYKIDDYVKNFDLYSVHFNGEFANRESIQTLKKMGIKTFAWTINTLEEGKILDSFGIDGIITNYPDIFIK